MFSDYLSEIYSSQLTVQKANKSGHLTSYLDLTLLIDSDSKLSMRIYDKHIDFDFQIVNFPFLSSNILSDPSYGVYVSRYDDSGRSNFVSRLQSLRAREVI